MLGSVVIKYGLYRLLQKLTVLLTQLTITACRPGA